jgi:hypothetical protein
MDIGWILTDEINAGKIQSGHYRVMSVDGVKECDITYRDGRMLFNGEDIETEDFMAYVGLLDAIDEGETHFPAENG